MIGSAGVQRGTLPYMVVRKALLTRSHLYRVPKKGKELVILYGETIPVSRRNKTKSLYLISNFLAIWRNGKEADEVRVE